MKTRIEIPLCIVIPAKDEPPLHVFLQSEDDGRGRLTFAQGSRAWTASWSGLDLDFLTFLRRARHAYLARHLLPGTQPAPALEAMEDRVLLFQDSLKSLPGLDKAAAYVEALDLRIKKLKRTDS